MDAVVLTTMKGLRFEVLLRSGRPSRQPDLQVTGGGQGAGVFLIDAGTCLCFGRMQLLCVHCVLGQDRDTQACQSSKHLSTDQAPHAQIQRGDAVACFVV
jgi:hypothetical protein